jgi:anti-anti-sigma factor
MQMEVLPLGERYVKVTLQGRLDTPGVDRIETRFLASLVPGGNTAIVDLSQVDFISSMGIRMLVSAARSLKMRQAALAVFGVQPQVSQLLEVVAIDQMIPICGTEAEAQTAVGHGVA